MCQLTSSMRSLPESDRRASFAADKLRSLCLERLQELNIGIGRQLTSSQIWTLMDSGFQLWIFIVWTPRWIRVCIWMWFRFEVECLNWNLISTTNLKLNLWQLRVVPELRFQIKLKLDSKYWDLDFTLCICWPEWHHISMPLLWIAMIGSFRWRHQVLCQGLRHVNGKMIQGPRSSQRRPKYCKSERQGSEVCAW